LTVRAVVDPGVLVSALFGKDCPPDAIVQEWKQGRFELIVSPQLVAELVEVVSRPKFSSQIFPEDVAELVELLRQHATAQGDPPHVERLTEDPDDDYLAALAVAARADYLVTGDHALQRWRSDAVTVVSPREFLEQLAE
jgi:putative PIN family toxin of toxin-antitoxin system